MAPTLLENLVEDIVQGIYFPKVNPIGMSHQFERHHDSMRNVLYVRKDDSTFSSLRSWLQRTILRVILNPASLSSIFALRLYFSQLQADHHSALIVATPALAPPKRQRLTPILQTPAGVNHSDTFRFKIVINLGVWTNTRRFVNSSWMGARLHLPSAQNYSSPSFTNPYSCV